jgi:hypothetical protein
VCRPVKLVTTGRVYRSATIICTRRSLQVSRQPNKIKRRIDYALASDPRIGPTLGQERPSSRGGFLAISGLLLFAIVDDPAAGAPLVLPILGCAASASASGEVVVEACEPKGCTNTGFGREDRRLWRGPMVACVVSAVAFEATELSVGADC